MGVRIRIATLLHRWSRYRTRIGCWHDTSRNVLLVNVRVGVWDRKVFMNPMTVFNHFIRHTDNSSKDGVAIGVIGHRGDDTF